MFAKSLFKFMFLFSATKIVQSISDIAVKIRNHILIFFIIKLSVVIWIIHKIMAIAKNIMFVYHNFIYQLMNDLSSSDKLLFVFILCFINGAKNIIAENANSVFLFELLFIFVSILFYIGGYKCLFLW